jgi:hypothetical protein
MPVHDKTTQIFHEIVFKERPARVAIDGPQEAVITAVTGAVCYFTIPAIGGAFQYGPAPYPAGSAPAAGMRCLAVFVGAGVGDPWVIGVTTAPKPAGF